MRATDLQVPEMLQFDPEQGWIHLHKRRVVLVNAHALGALRKDLIDSLGLERARGFLTRYGWSCGFHDAVDMKNRYPWAGEIEWLRAASRLHTLEGAVHVKVEQSRIDKEAGLFDVAGIWRNSYEADQHVQHLGRHTGPVCWTLVGYASGYGSAYMGRRVIYREVACVGQGDPYCRFVGKTAAQWGEAITPELVYFEPDRSAEHTERSYRQLQVQHAHLRQATAIDEALTRLVLDGKGLQEIVQHLASLSGLPVLVEDGSRRLVAFSPAAALPPQLRRPGEPGPVGWLAAEGRHSDRLRILEDDGRPVAMPPLPAAGVDRTWLAAPIVLGQRLTGYVSVMLAGEEHELEGRVLARAAPVFALEMLKSQAVTEAEQRILGDLLGTLFTGEAADAKALVRRARHLGLDLDQTYQVIVVSTGASDGADAADHRLLRELQGQLDRLSPGSQVSRLEPDWLVLYRVAAGAPAPQQAAEQVVGRLRAALGEDAAPVAGIGGACRAVADYPAAYRQARAAVEMGISFGRRQAVICFADLGAYAVLLEATDRTRLVAWAEAYLQPLLRYDARRRTELLTTLEHYLQTAGSLVATARAANLHISGVKYRLRRVEELLGLDLSQGQSRLDLHLALMVARMGGLLPAAAPSDAAGGAKSQA